MISEERKGKSEESVCKLILHSSLFSLHSYSGVVKINSRMT